MWLFAGSDEPASEEDNSFPRTLGRERTYNTVRWVTTGFVRVALGRSQHKLGP